MNTGISKSQLRVAVCCTAMLTLGGCIGGGDGFSFAAANKVETGGAQIGPAIPKAAQTTLARGTVKIKAPKNFCIDESSISNGLNGSFVRLAKCTALDGKGGAAATTAVMTVNISNRRTETATAPTLQDLADVVAPAEVISSTQKGALALVHVASGGDEHFAPADPRHWRGATQLDTRLVLLSLYAPKGGPMAGPAGATLLESMARGISATRGGLLGVNRPDIQEDAAEPDVIAAQGAGTDATVAENDTPNGIRRVFGRLFN